MNRYLTVNEVAELSTLSVQQVYRLIQARKIPHTRIGGRVFMNPDAIERWIAEHTVGVAS